MEENCSNEYPSTALLFKEIKNDPISIFLMSGVVLTFIIISILFIEKVVFIFKNIEDSSRRNKTLMLMALYPVIGGSSCLILIAPKVTIIGEFLSQLYLSVCIFVFVRLMLEYFGKEPDMWRHLHGDPISFKTILCRCCNCDFTSGSANKRTIRVIKILVAQVVIVKTISLLAEAVFCADGMFYVGDPFHSSIVTDLTSSTIIQIDFTNPGVYISSINGLSALLAVYSMVITYQWLRPKLEGFRMAAKFLSIQLVVVILNLQSPIFRILGQNGVPHCLGSRGSLVRAARFHYYLLIVEMLFLAVLARFAFRRVDGIPSAVRNYERNISSYNHGIKNNDKDGKDTTTADTCSNDCNLNVESVQIMCEKFEVILEGTANLAFQEDEETECRTAI